MYNEYIKKHYKEFWGEFTEHRFDRGPVDELPPAFEVLKFPPCDKHDMWIYATCGMSGEPGRNAVELHMYVPEEYDFLIELLTIVVHYHITGESLGLGHSINFGCSWYPGSRLEYGFISLPYIDGPAFENLQTEMKVIKFLWLIPITVEERNYKKQNGLEALERKLEETGFNYLDPYRESVV